MQSIKKVLPTRSSDCWGYILIAFQTIALLIVLALFVSLKFGYMTIVSNEAYIGAGADDSSSYALNTLMGHVNGTGVNAEENTVLYELFHSFDADGDTKLSYSEFSECVTQTLNTAATFDLINIRQSGVIRYDELVFVLQTLSLSAFGLTSALETLYASDYNSNAESELLAQTVFFGLDRDKSGSITKEEWNDSEIKKQWARIAGDRPLHLNIAFHEFKDAFFSNPTFSATQTLYKKAENGEFDPNFIRQTCHAKRAQGDMDVFGATLSYSVHFFDERFESESESVRRRQLDLGGLFSDFVGIVDNGLNDVWDFTKDVTTDIVGGIVNTGTGVSTEVADIILGEGCYYDGSVVDVFGVGSSLMKDVKIGDYVYDGNEYSKVFFVERYNKVVQMIEIFYGIPKDKNSIRLTAQHLLYTKNSELPMKSGSISINDVLEGISSSDANNNNNFTVYDISIFYGNPISPITMSGKLIVNGIQTSVYSHSVKESIRLQNGGAIFRWMSDNVNEYLAAQFVDFYYNVIYKKLMNKRFFALVTSNEITAILYVLSVPIFVVFIATRVWNPRLFGDEKFKTVHY